MINQELLLLLHHIFLCLAQGYWYSLEEQDECFPTCLATARLNQFQYETILLSSTILYRFGNSVRFSQERLDNLKVSLEQQQNMTIHITKANLHGRKWLFICIGNPRCPVPVRQVRNNIRVPRICQVGNRLSPDDYHVIACLCQERAVVEDVPIVVANEEELVEEVEEVIEAVGVQDQVVEVPVLLDEEEVEMVEEPYYPYQLTRYYQNVLVRFPEAFEERMNETYERERIIFEQQQQQQYNDALIVEGEQQEQQQQQQIINLPDVVVEEEENVNNNDIIINNIPGDDYEDDINNNDIIIDEADIDVVDDDDDNIIIIIINDDNDDRDDDGAGQNNNIIIDNNDADDRVDDDRV
jgi:hypothetical protein